jgi:phage terminase large subunit-like protein
VSDAAPTSLEFFARLHWIDGRPLLATLEPYRRRLFAKALDDHRTDGRPRINLVLSGRAKKNYKSTDLVLAALYCLLNRESHQGNDGFVLANDEDQAGDDLALAKKLVAVNSELTELLETKQKAILRRDGLGSLQILPARDAIGAHGKTAAFIGYDEIHGYRNYDLLEALAPDPTRDALTWVTSYDTIYNVPGVPLVDYKRLGQSGSDPRMLFSWYSGDLCTDPEFADLPPEQRANPSMASWPEGMAYLDQQRRRLPTHKFRRLHLNMPGAPNGAFLDQGAVIAAIVSGRHVLPPQEGVQYFGFVDMSGGSGDDAVVAIGHDEEGIAVLDLVKKQASEPPFNPRQAVERFAKALKSYRVSTVSGDAYGGLTFKQDFERLGISFRSSTRTKSQIYEAFEPRLNAGEVELLDIPKLQEQLLTLVTRGARIDHEPNGHDDWANAAAGVVCAIMDSRSRTIDDDIGFVSVDIGEHAGKIHSISVGWERPHGAW